MFSCRDLFGKSLFLLGWLTLVSTVLWTEECLAAEWNWAGPGYVLLENGNVVEAVAIESQKDSIRVQLDKTGEIKLPNQRVITIGKDIRSLYDFQIATTPRWQSGEHLQMAKWCLRNGLVDEAFQHYLQLKELTGQHAKFKQIEAELAQTLLKDPSMQAALQPTQANQSIVSPTQAATKQSPVAKTKSENRHPDNPLSEEFFRRQIQPVLAMRCGQGGCHGSLGKSNFHIAKSGHLHGRPASEMSFHSAIAFFDGEAVEETSLWRNATSKHGNQPIVSIDPSLPTDREIIDRLRQWHSLHHTPTKAAAIELASTKPTANTNLGHTNGAIENANVGKHNHPARLSETNGEEPPKLVTNGSLPELPNIGSEILMLEQQIAKLEEKERSRTSKASSRYDPEVFNQKYHNTLRP
jgi:hypothetical protein